MMISSSLCGSFRSLLVRKSHLIPSIYNIQAATYLKTRRAVNFTNLDIERGPKPVLMEEPDERFAINSFQHHKPRYTGPRNKFVSPRKKANKMYDLIMKEAIAKAKEETPQVWQENFEVGDAIEIHMVEEGGKNCTDPENLDTVRGVVLGIFRKKLDFSVLIRDCVDGEEIERKIQLHSPMIKSLRIIEKNFIYKGKRRPRRAKLYWLSDRNPMLCQVTGYKQHKEKVNQGITAKMQKRIKALERDMAIEAAYKEKEAASSSATTDHQEDKEH